MAAAKATPGRAGTVAIARRLAQAATAACSIGTRARSVDLSIRPVLMIARRAIRATGAATGISIRSDPGMAMSSTARTVLADSRIVSANIVAADIAAAGRA